MPCRNVIATVPRMGARLGRAGLVIIPCALLCASALSAGAQEGYDPLAAALQSRRESTRLEAVRQLGVSARPDAPAMLARSLLDLSNRVQLETIDALLSMVRAPDLESRKPAAFASKNGSIAANVFDAGPLAVLPRELPDAVLLNLSATVRDDDSRVRRAAAAALGVLARLGPVSEEVNRAFVTDIVYGLQQPDAETREAIVRAAGAIFARNNGAPPVAVGDALIARMNDSEVDVRIAAMDALGWTHEERAALALADRVAFYGRGDAALSALHALARLAPPEQAGLFRARLTDPDPEFRVVAIEGLGRVGDRESVPAIDALLRREQDPAVLLAGAFAFYRLGEKGNLDRIIVALADRATSRQARAYITELCPDAAPRVQQYLQQPDPRMRQAVSEVLGFCGNEASGPALEVAVRDSDPAAAEAARQARLRLRAFPDGLPLH